MAKGGEIEGMRPVGGRISADVGGGGCMVTHERIGNKIIIIRYWCSTW